MRLKICTLSCNTQQYDERKNHGHFRTSDIKIGNKSAKELCGAISDPQKATSNLNFKITSVNI